MLEVQDEDLEDFASVYNHLVYLVSALFPLPTVEEYVNADVSLGTNTMSSDASEVATASTSANVFK